MGLLSTRCEEVVKRVCAGYLECVGRLPGGYGRLYRGLGQLARGCSESVCRVWRGCMEGKEDCLEGMERLSGRCGEAG